MTTGSSDKTAAGIAGDVALLWDDAKANDPQVRGVLEDPRLQTMTPEQVAGMFFGLGAFAALRIAVAAVGREAAQP